MIPRILISSITARLIALFTVSFAAVDLAFAAPPAAPSVLRFEASAGSDIATIAWNDNSANEERFLLELKVGDEVSFRFWGSVAADTTSLTLTGYTPGVPVVFRVQAENTDGVSAFSNEATVVTQGNYQIAASCVTVTPGGDFSRQIQTNFGGDVSLSSDLPAWMSWDDATDTLSGTVAPTGIAKLTLSASSGPHSRTRDFFVQAINQGPVEQGLPSNLFYILPAGGPGPGSIDLTNHFVDSDMGRAAVMITPFGPIRVGLFDDDDEGAPLTVENFFAYAEANHWDGTFFHRSVRNFVIQGGGFVPDDGNEGDFLRVPTFDPVVNEFNDLTRSNICGTIAMAKMGGDPDSATNQWFFSLQDNASILDPQNGGFTVFGRAIDMDVIDQISAFDTGTYGVFVDGGGSPSNFADWPLSTTSANSPLVSELASMSRVVEIPTLSFEVTGGGSVVVAEIVGTELQLTTLAEGQADLEITATDLDGAVLSKIITIGVYPENSYGAWAVQGELIGANSAPDENFGGGVLGNLQRYAFGGDEVSSVDDAAVSPIMVKVEDGGGTYDAIRFYHRKVAPDLSYTVQMSSDLDMWGDLWTTSDGNSAPLVTTVEDLGDFWRLTVRAPEKVGLGSPRQFFQVLVTLEE